MTTQLFFRYGASVTPPQIHRGTNSNKLNGSASGWEPMSLSTSRGAGAQSLNNAVTEAGPTSGVEAVAGTSLPVEFISLPLDADFTISGTITVNLWARELNMSANAAINVAIDRLGPTGSVVSNILTTTRSTEVNLSSYAVNNFTGTPTSTTMKKGDRLRIRVFFDDAGTMAAGFEADFECDGASAGVDGDSYVTFTETFGFQITDPSGSKLYLTNTAGPDLGATIEKEMWTAVGGGSANIVVNTTAGWTAPIQWTNAAGGTAVEWYSRPLNAFTLDGLVMVNIWPKVSAVPACGLRVELAVVNGDGTGAVVWGAASIYDSSSPTASSTTFQLATTEIAFSHWLAGPATAVTAGQRLRFRVYIDDDGQSAMTNGETATLYYAGTSGGSSGDSFIVLPQTVTENVAGHPRPFRRSPEAMFRAVR